MVTYTDGACNDEVHLGDLLFLVVDDLAVFVVRKVARDQAESDIIQEFSAHVLLRIEKDAEVVKDIVEEKMHYDGSSNTRRQSLKVLIGLLHLLKPIIGPVVLEMLVDLPVDQIRQRFILTEPRQQGHPVVQLKLFFCSRT